MFNAYTRTIFVNLHGESLYVTILYRGYLMTKEKYYIDRTQIPKHLRHLSDRRLKALQELFKGRFTWMNR